MGLNPAAATSASRRWRSVRRPGSARTGRARGFSLIEVMMAAMIGVMLTSAFTYAITIQLRSTRAQEQAQRSRDDATRLNYLIQTEASEAVNMAQAEVISNCVSTANGQTSLFSLTIPRPTLQFDDLGNIAKIYYYSATTANGTDLRRCGPSIQRNGSLDFSQNVDGIVNTNTILGLVTCPAVNGTVSSSREVAYQLTLNDLPGGYRPPCAIDRAKAFRVVDP